MLYRITQLLLFLGFALSLNAQTYPVTVGGTVTDVNGGLVPNAYLWVTIFPDDPQGFSDWNLVQTDNDGNYSNVIEVPESVVEGTVYVAIIDCDSNSVTQSANFGVNSNNVFDLDFTFCGNPSGGCNSWLSAQHLPAAVVLSVVSNGVAPFTYYWNNGSATTDSVITVTQSGTYCVAVEDANNCLSSSCVTVQIVLAGGCSVQVEIDSTNAGIIAHTSPTGTLPFTYLWNDGSTSEYIPFQPGTNPCVTVTDALGCVAEDCLFSQPPVCNVTLSIDPANTGIWANPTGSAPFVYLWNTGQTTQSIIPNNFFGVYCVTVTDANGCTAEGCIQWGGGLACGVTVFDSVPAPSGEIWLHASPWGQAPFTFQWSTQNASSQAVLVDSIGTYCVTITDATGCSASDCITLGFDSCMVYIVEGNVSLFAIVPNTPGWTFEWSNGETGQSIVPSSPGTYCVTATNTLNSNCISAACHEYAIADNYTISGYVMPPDSNVFVGLEGTAELFLVDSVTGQVYLVDSAQLQTSPAGSIGGFYDFGQVLPGVYLVKISIDPNSPDFNEYLPTYYGNVLLWQNATSINVPHGGGYFNIVLVDGNPFGGGNNDGIIGGTVTHGDGFTANGNGNRGGGAPVPNVSILLLDQQEQPITHTLTDENGKYQFENLDFGTYKVGVEIPGKEQAWRWVTLTQENPVIENQDFSVSESGVSDAGETEKIALPILSALPNPVKDVLTIKVQSPTYLEVRLSLNSAAGCKVFEQVKTLDKGSQTIQIDVANLPAGLYFLNLTGGRQVVSTRIVKK